MTASGARQTRKVFGDKVEKELPIPDFINEYNCYMCGVDIADQLRSYFNTQRIYRKTWKPLFHFLLDTTLGNCYRLSSYKSPGPQDTRNEGHKLFRKDLRNALFEHSTRTQKNRINNPPPRKSTNDIIWQPVKDHKLVNINKLQNCSVCVEAGYKTQVQNRARRKSLADLSVNTTRKPVDSSE